MHGNHKIMTELLSSTILNKTLIRASKKAENTSFLNTYRKYIPDDFFEFKESSKTLYEPEKIYIFAKSYTQKDFSKELNSNKKTIFAKIVSISEDKNDVVIDIVIDGIIQKQKLKSYFIDILEKSDSLFVGAEFNFLYERIDNGIQIKIQTQDSKNISQNKYYIELRDLWLKKIHECVEKC